MPASPVSAFKARLRKEVTLPQSGLVVEITIIDCLSFVGVGELPVPEAGAGDSEDSDPRARMLRNQAYIDRAIAMGAVSPPFSNRPEDRGRPDVVHVTELPYGDRLYLGRAIMEYAGLSEDWATQVSSFRADEERAADPGAGGALPPPAARDPGGDAGRAVPRSDAELPA